MNSNDKVYGILAYIGILVLVPIFAGQSEFARFHANQGLVLFLSEIVLGVASGIVAALPVVGFIGGLVGGLVSLLAFIFMIIGIINAAQGQMRELPIIGTIRILK